jgi:hypothetical protein
MSLGGQSRCFRPRRHRRAFPQFPESRHKIAADRRHSQSSVQRLVCTFTARLIPAGLAVTFDSFGARWYGLNMRVFIDEGGTFVPWTGWGVVCSLALPHNEFGPTRREIDHLSRDWPRKDGELKGGLLRPPHLAVLVDVLFRHDALVHACAVDVSREDSDGIERHKTLQCEGITKHLTDDHHPNLVRQVRDLRHLLERMPRQLYLQSVIMSELVCSASEETAMYFAQRRPRGLAEFEWTIDAKDPKKITTYEKWWRDTLGPLLESRSRRDPMRLVKDPDFNYRFFDRSFVTRKKLWYSDRPRETVDCYDITKMITKRIEFVDSRTETLIQTVDVYASFLRRLLAGEIAGDDISRALGRLQIIRRHEGGQPQSLRVLTISRKPGGRTGLFRTLRTMTIAGRSMKANAAVGRLRLQASARAQTTPGRGPAVLTSEGWRTGCSGEET